MLRGNLWLHVKGGALMALSFSCMAALFTRVSVLESFAPDLVAIAAVGFLIGFPLGPRLLDESNHLSGWEKRERAARRTQRFFTFSDKERAQVRSDLQVGLIFTLGSLLCLKLGGPELAACSFIIHAWPSARRWYEYGQIGPFVAMLGPVLPLAFVGWYAEARGVDPRLVWLFGCVWLLSNAVQTIRDMRKTLSLAAESVQLRSA